MWNSLSDFDRMFVNPKIVHRQMTSILNSHRAKSLCGKGEYQTAVNLYDDENHFRLIALVPGVVKEDIDIQIEGQNLFLATTLSNTVPEGYRLRDKQRPQEVSKRTFKLPVDIDKDKVTATLENGVLTLIIPKAESVQPTKIAIS